MARRPHLSVLFDENMSAGVAAALKCLEKDVDHVASRREKAGVGPKKKVSDGLVADMANREKRVVLTMNFDMVLAACDRGVRFIWFDKRRRELTMLDTAFILLRKWNKWETMLSDPTVECLKVGRGTESVLAAADARRRALQRYKRAKAVKKKTQRSVAARNQQRLDFGEGS